jgi:hypothetical protein
MHSKKMCDYTGSKKELEKTKINLEETRVNLSTQLNGILSLLKNYKKLKCNQKLYNAFIANL